MSYALFFCRLWYYCFWQGFVREFGVELVGVCRECEKDDGFNCVESQVQVVLLCVSSDTSASEFCHPLISCLL